MRLVLRQVILILCAASVAPGFADEGSKETKDCCRHWHSDSDFAWQVQADVPAKDLGRALDERTGVGLGMQWLRQRDNGVANRTRLEWNVFPEGNPVGEGLLKTKASNIVLSFDRLYHLSGTAKGVYVFGGLGGVRWAMDRTAGTAPTVSSHTTKLAATAGAGYRFSRAFSAEARYLVSSVDRTFDGNVMQAGFSMRF